MHNARPHVQEHELDPPVGHLEIERLSTIFLSSLFGGEDARFEGQHNRLARNPTVVEDRSSILGARSRSRSNLTVAYDVAPKAQMTQEETLATSIF